MDSRAVDNRATLAPTLPELRQQLQAAIATYAGDVQLRRALIHAEGTIADRLGERRDVIKRSERRRTG